jgi:uncharacterized membrane protein YdjX (TVP38/TMEM64 family)
MTTATHKKAVFYRWLPLGLIGAGIIIFFYFHLYNYLSFTSIKEHRQLYLNWTHENYWLAVGAFLGLYSIIIAISIPGTIFFTLASGFLFGTWWGSLFVLVGETVGCTLTFLAVKMSLGEWISKKASKWVLKMESEFQKNAFNYIITLRLIPILPFWLVNIAAALLKVRLVTFVSSTFIGIIPLTLIYVSLGHSLGIIFEKNAAPNLEVIFQPHILLPLLGLSVFAMFPVIYQLIKKQKRNKLSKLKEAEKLVSLNG